MNNKSLTSWDGTGGVGEKDGSGKLRGKETKAQYAHGLIVVSEGEYMRSQSP
ncbi:uncharacterized protein LAESUDRAFT_723257 [Laetiporus sulphureus 93-53]|uniref:Uncharacterized protein n=1 Tax=Laetiporus sulphureus 93-53 TaxID=1314785 RepID=A0A165FGX5_9APHY|nr:uncharacterized protein LAESUDRAFT_723257 [Laetiporus sulphureus 93-53]KZT08954.1 hypothetical protein LAESUDRAFT_723257 [Laetiporus sulphureus 93-53]